MNKKNSSKQELEDVLNIAAESFLELSDSAIVEMEREAGREVKEAVSYFRNVLREADKEYRQRHLRAAKQKHAIESKKLVNINSDLPKTPEERKSLLGMILYQFPEYQLGLTFQNRNFESLSDSDIEETLKQLEALGVLNELKKSQSNKE